MRRVPRRAVRITFFTLAALTYVEYQKYRNTNFLTRESLFGRQETGVSERSQAADTSVENNTRKMQRTDSDSVRIEGQYGLLWSKPEPTSGDLCKELVRSFRNHLHSVELLTLAQFPSAAKEEEQGDSQHASYLNAPASTRFQCDDSEAILTSPKQLLDVFLFGGGEVDTLEIRLHELYAVVDVFIAVTSNVTHKGEPAFDALRPLLRTRRFERFRDKVEIFEYGQTGVVAPKEVNFQFEIEKESAVSRYLGERYDNNTLVIFGHVDEIPAREDVWKLSNCKQHSLPGNFGIWFPYGNVDYAFKSDFPASSKPWTLGDPGVTTANGLNEMGLPRGRFKHVLGRGFHATNYCFPPQYILKMITATEYNGFDAMIDEIKNAFGENKTCAQIMQGVRERCLNNPVRAFSSRMRRVSDLVSSGENAEQFYIPHALRTGKYTRYPSWDPAGRAVDWRTTASLRSPE